MKIFRYELVRLRRLVEAKVEAAKPKESEIKISGSSGLALLAGVVTQEQLFENLGFKPHSKKVSAIGNTRSVTF